jgi:hypothetical protein
VKATVTINGAQYVYPDGPALPNYFVEFRADGSIAFILGTIWTDAATHLNITAHHVKIEDNSGAVVYDADLTDHWWGACWTYRPKPLRAVRTPAQIVAMRASFPFGDTGVPVKGPSKAATYKGPMDTSTVTVYMPTTGERGDIGHLTDASAWWMLGNPPDGMFAWAQAGDSCSIRFRDEKTGRPIDLLKNPTANCYFSSAQGTPWIRGAVDKGTNPWTAQEAHFCDMWFLACMATQDLNILEGLQYAANFMLLNDNALSRKQGKAVLHGEYRGLAWAFGMLFKAWFATKDAEARGPLPAFLHPSSYWQTLIDQSADYYLSQMTGHPYETFSLMCKMGRYSPWMHDYLCTTMGLGALMGQPKAATIFNKIIKNNVDRASGKSGYPYAYMNPYRMNTSQPAVPGKDGDLKQPPLDWPGAFKSFIGDYEAPITQADYDRIIVDQSNGGVQLRPSGYINEFRSAMAMADYLDKNGIVPVRATHPDFDLAYGHALTFYKNYGHPYLRTAVVATAPPASPQPQPATGVTFMPSTANLKIGETRQLNLTVTPADAERTGLSYHVVPDGILTLKPNDAGVAVTRTAAGNAQIIADLNGHEAEADATFIPLAESLALEWA